MGQIWVISLYHAEFDGHHSRSFFSALQVSEVEQFRISNSNFALAFGLERIRGL